MKNRDEGLNRVESVTTIIVNIGTIISWIITLVTALTLIAQPQPIVIPGLFELGKPYAITFFVSVLFGYVQLLRRFWYHSQTTKEEIESSFGSFLYGSIVKFKRPIVSIGFVIILIVIYQIEPVGTSVFLFICLSIGIGIGFSMLDNQPSSTKKFFWRLDEEFHRRWLKRIRNKLHENGYVFTSDFSDLGVNVGEANWAIEDYFNLYEFEQDLTLTKHANKERVKRKVFLELRFNHLPTRLRNDDVS